MEFFTRNFQKIVEIVISNSVCGGSNPLYVVNRRRSGRNATPPIWLTKLSYKDPKTSLFSIKIPVQFIWTENPEKLTIHMINPNLHKRNPYLLYAYEPTYTFMSCGDRRWAFKEHA